jgi:hypothetical protein
MSYINSIFHKVIIFGERLKKFLSTLKYRNVSGIAENSPPIQEHGIIGVSQKFGKL